MGRRPGPDVSVWALRDRRADRVPRPWVVRWRVGARTHSRAFTHNAQAEAYRARLLVALGDGERFDAATGVPVSWAVEDLTVAAWAGRWFAEQRPTWAPRSRRSAAEVLARALPILVSGKAPTPPATLRADVQTWLSGGGDIPAWLARWSLPLADVNRDRAAVAWAAISTKADGTPMAAETSKRYRTTLRSLFAEAVARGLIDEQPWPTARRGRAATRVRRAVDVSLLPGPAQARAALGRVRSHQPESQGHQVVLSLVYFAGLRPSEARALRAERCTLPETGWGSLRVDVTDRGAGDDWTDEDEVEGDPKADSVRDVPVPPELVAILREWLGDRTEGLVVVTRDGNAVSTSNLNRSWRRARGTATWRVYDLRHAAATLMLGAGVPIGEAARRLGHSPEVLLRTYAGVLVGDEATANQRIEEALS